MAGRQCGTCRWARAVRKTTFLRMNALRVGLLVTPKYSLRLHMANNRMANTFAIRALPLLSLQDAPEEARGRRVCPGETRVQRSASPGALAFIYVIGN